MRSTARWVVCALMLLAIGGQAFPQAPGPVTDLLSYTMDNGMEVFVLENHLVPLVRIQIAFRTGAVSQTPDTAGLFHLYEHMLFKGNRAYPTQRDLQDAMKAMGVGSWNGGTGSESVTYYFTIPSDRVRQGIAFWADAVRYPLLDPAELQTEKDVVVNEILGYLSDPNNLYSSALDKAMFAAYPWRKDVSGSEKLIRAATVKDLQSIRDTWYVPNNAALFVGGDVDPQVVRAAAQQYFGDWRRGKDPWDPPPPAHPAPVRDALLVYPDPQMYQGVAAVAILFRGPDVTRDPAATYAADALMKLLDDPNGRFKASVFAKVPGMYNKDYLSAGYFTQRDGGEISFSTYLMLSTGRDTFQRAGDLRTVILGEMAAISGDPAYFSQQDFDVLKRQLSDERIFERETAGGFIGALSFWWSTASTAYYLGYGDALQKVDRGDMAGMLATYVLGRHSVMALRMNPKDFAREQASAQRQGWQVIGRDNAYWWSDQGKGEPR